ncbi:MAG: hypothetical protein A2289_25070 [Deltaproteobacteria bacterium RIFOXYA12_FULL_58_15]|nr:MAG: hypothetical protein A2289_25070 [Deltaproteobacteria bacterium RIFOXYA12_FULL_58_15]
MATVESAKSGRAKCRKCKASIAKGDLRFGNEVETAFGESVYWYHLNCAAAATPVELARALETTSEDIPNRADLDKQILAGRKGAKPTVFPYAERAASGRSTCLACSDKIAKGDLRVAIESEIDTGAFTKKGPKYLHAGCATKHAGDDGLVEALEKHSTSLSDTDLLELKKLLQALT